MCVGKLSVRENVILGTVCRENIFLENCPLEKSMNCALENFLWATVCHGNVREGTAPLCKCFIRIFKFLRRTCQLHLIHYNIFNILIMLVAFVRVSLLRLLCSLSNYETKDNKKAFNKYVFISNNSKLLSHDTVFVTTWFMCICYVFCHMYWVIYIQVIIL